MPKRSLNRPACGDDHIPVRRRYRRDLRPNRFARASRARCNSRVTPYSTAFSGIGLKRSRILATYRFARRSIKDAVKALHRQSSAQRPGRADRAGPASGSSRSSHDSKPGGSSARTLHRRRRDRSCGAGPKASGVRRSNDVRDRTCCPDRLNEGVEHRNRRDHRDLAPPPVPP